jgi:hypothetical protein
MTKPNKKIKHTKIGKELIHTYQSKDNWDGSFCSDFCIGCGDCDHFPIRYATRTYNIKAMQLAYYCNECSVTNEVKLDVPKEDYDIVVYYNSQKDCYEKTLENIHCADCKKMLGESPIISVSYSSDSVCNKCAKKYTSEEKSFPINYERVDEFFCYLCKKEFRIIAKGKKKCENISKLNKFEQYQIFFDVDGKITEKIISQNIK